MRDLPVIEDPWIGKTLDGRFEVLGLLGKGGMGAIYRCRDVESDLVVAIKIILEEYATDPEVLARFEREIQANVDVVHPNVVKTFGHGRTTDGVPYFAMELLQGTLLDELIDDEDLTSEAIAHIGAQIALGLNAAHQRGIVHRDLKPSNVIVGDDGTVKVFDFGLSLLRPEGLDAEPTGEKRLTEMDMRIGTPLYMAPEYIEGGDLDARSDLYALGVVLYECCTGRTPFNGAAYKVLHQHANQPPRPIEDRVPGRHPDWLREAIHKLLAKKPDDRPSSGSEVARLLTRAPEVAVPVNTVTPMDSRVPAAPHSVPPLAALPQSGLGRLLLPLILIASVIWHGFSVGANVGSEDLPPGRSVATLWTASHVAADRGNPYDPDALDAAALAHDHKGKVGRPFAPPAFLAAMSWTRTLSVPVAWATWLGAQEVLFLATVLLIWVHWRSLGRAPRLAFTAAGAILGAVPTALDLGIPSLLLLFLVLAAARAERTDGSGELEAGLWLGLATLVSLRAWILLPWWLVRGRWTTALVAALVFVAGSLLAVPIVGMQALAGFWTTAVPDLWTGDVTGLGLRINVFGNHSPAQLFDALVPGRTGQQLSTVSLVGVWGVGALGAGGLTALSWGTPTDRFGEQARLATWLLAALLLPIFAHESWVPLALPAVALVITGLWRGRLPPWSAVPLGIAIAIVCYPVDPIRVLYQQIFLPDLPWLAPLLRQLKPLALLALTAATVALAVSRPSATQRADTGL